MIWFDTDFLQILSDNVKQQDSTYSKHTNKSWKWMKIFHFKFDSSSLSSHMLLGCGDNDNLWYIVYWRLGLELIMVQKGGREMLYQEC